ncbi:MAG TPA: hypothetical protein DCZ95_05990 [Verrucomicrobia bacterium]|nr:MAG: hypothetical protein A2X46_03790 [Lentisphaerae bacterium GWF2_57_35]HBA83629.1 hypothetical protein [Verrucomicrobiota bacterium]
MLYRLIFLNTDAKGQRVTVDMAPMTIGRDSDCTIVVKDDEISRKHAVLEHKPEGLFIRDLGSMNRILVNGREVREKRLKHGDRIELGRTQLLVQAVVQAEVELVESKELVSPKKEFALTTTIFVILLATVLAGGLVFWRKLTASRSRSAAAQAAAHQVAAVRPATGRGEKAAVVLATNRTQAVSEELKYMRKALTDIRTTVDTLAQNRAAEGSAQTNAAAWAERALRAKAEGKLKEAHTKISSNEFEEADRILSGIQLMLPDFLPAYEERAQLFEKQGQLEKAIGQWAQMVQRSSDTNLHRKALSERARLGQVESAVTPEASREIRIVSIEQHKFLESSDFDEMRILNIALSPTSHFSSSNAGAVRVEVVFYDEDRQTGLIASTTAVSPKEALRMDGPWDGQEPKMITATYVAPRVSSPQGLSTSRTARFYGYAVRVYCGERLEDQDARPRSLLNFRAEISGNDDGRTQAPGLDK